LSQQDRLNHSADEFMSETVRAESPSPASLSMRDRALIMASLIGVSTVSWLYLVHLARQMQPMARMPNMVAAVMSPMRVPWSATDFLLMLVMWSVMMVGMMLPSASPIILTFATVNRRKRERGLPFLPTFAFTAGYLLVWGAFGLAATLAQWEMERSALMLASMKTGSAILAGILCFAAGFYQWTPLKRACLANCRSPLDFVINRWHDGRLGALRMGIEHGAYCLGCCAVIMALLFVSGVMNLLWVAAIAVLVFVEKLLPAGERIARGSGVLMIAFGGYLLVTA
jgi:predicted metal-binding membrane protein